MEIVNGVMFFNSYSPNGKLSFLNNTVVVYEDVLGVWRFQHYYDCVALDVEHDFFLIIIEQS